MEWLLQKSIHGSYYVCHKSYKAKVKENNQRKTLKNVGSNKINVASPSVMIVDKIVK